MTWPGKRENEGKEDRLRGTREPAPRRRDVSRTRLVAVGRAVVVGGSRQIRPTATISFYFVNVYSILCRSDKRRVQVMRGRDW